MSAILLNTPEVFNQQFKRGVIIWTRMVFHNGTSGKKLLVPVNLDCQDETTYCVRCTSNVRRYGHEPYRSKGVIVDEACPVFDLPTVIDCGTPIDYQRTELVARFCSGELRFKNMLPLDVLETVDEKLRMSKDISPNIKTLIVSQ